MTHTIETVTTYNAIQEQAKQAAAQQQEAFLKHWTDPTGVNEYCEPVYCVFALVTVYSVH